MKKIFILIGILAASISCEKMNEVPVSDPENTHLELDINVVGETKGVKTAWLNNDKVYIFFTGKDGFLEIKYSSSTGKWTANSWSTGLEATIASTTSGTLSAVYSPITKCGGSMNYTTNYHFYAYSGLYHGYVLEHKNVTYSISAGKLSATINMTAPVTYNQFCLTDGTTFHHRDGTTINVNNYNEISRYTLEAGCGSTTTWANDLFGAKTDGSFFHQTNGLSLTAYFYGGLCFSMPDRSAGYAGLKFTLKDSKTSKTYVYTNSSVTIESWNSKSVHAFKLPDLNAQDGGVYKWVEQ